MSKGEAISIDFTFKTIELIKLKPSLTINIVRYVTKNLDEELERAFEVFSEKLWETYQSPDTREWSRFWILKTLISLKTKKRTVEKELKIKFETNELYTVLYAYFILVDKGMIELSQVESLLRKTKSDLFKSHILFFVHHTQKKLSKVQLFTIIEKALSSDNHDLNLIGLFLLDKPTFNQTKKLFTGIFSQCFNSDFTSQVYDFDKNKYALVEKKAIHSMEEILGTRKRTYIPKEPHPFIQIDEVEFEYENLKAWKEGRITYDDVEITLRPQIKDLCRLFMNGAPRLITFDDIKDNIISSRKRDITTNTTISKYVSVLSTALDNYSKTLTIKLHSKNGYVLKKTSIPTLKMVRK